MFKTTFFAPILFDSKFSNSKESIEFKDEMDDHIICEQLKKLDLYENID